MNSINTSHSFLSSYSTNMYAMQIREVEFVYLLLFITVSHITHQRDAGETQERTAGGW